MSQELPVRPSHLGIIASLLLVVAALGYAWHERGVSAQLSAQNAQISTTLDQTRNQMDALNSRLNQLSEAQVAATGGRRREAIGCSSRGSREIESQERACGRSA